MTTENARERIHTFLREHTGGQPLADTDDFFALGYVNSLFAMQLAAFVEKEFALTLGPDDMDFDNFRTVNGLVRLATSRTDAQS
ncbi:MULTISPECIES: acyl carrier protein [Nocardiopsis]|jgi:acyl carrier protein|uniref:Phosphopantetheine-binding protein n=1 Tax=Nocardiopsis tropica TaxID=109330 RepID=A0ABV2A064_9ACTN|nr:phosphopantetheine-binding protein [Nocardiopsis umidischolae]MEE2042434.1 phosphopantetheine-binding protein [Nocardiopsis tropica]MEE2050423.1 phosphopantetheine-binding protein [Nocardiopsis umidischolae]